MIVTTTDSLQGQTIVEYKGLVSGTAIHGVNVGKDFKALGRNLVGGRAGAYEDEIDQGQIEAMAEMQQAAEDLGANAIVGASIDVEGVGTNGSMLLVTVSGTAVVVRAG
jgi:uncharacterized protein YbjQ (UPF0145 family)